MKKTFSLSPKTFRKCILTFALLVVGTGIYCQDLVEYAILIAIEATGSGQNCNSLVAFIPDSLHANIENVDVQISINTLNGTSNPSYYNTVNLADTNYFAYLGYVILDPSDSVGSIRYAYQFVYSGFTPDVAGFTFTSLDVNYYSQYFWSFWSGQNNCLPCPLCPSRYSTFNLYSHIFNNVFYNSDYSAYSGSYNTLTTYKRRVMATIMNWEMGNIAATVADYSDLLAPAFQGKSTLPPVFCNGLGNIQYSSCSNQQSILDDMRLIDGFLSAIPTDDDTDFSNFQEFVDVGFLTDCDFGGNWYSPYMYSTETPDGYEIGLQPLLAEVPTIISSVVFDDDTVYTAIAYSYNYTNLDSGIIYTGSGNFAYLNGFIPADQNYGDIPFSRASLTAMGPVTFCNGDSVTLKALIGYSSYEWSNGSSTQEITVDTSGAYSVGMYDYEGCYTSPDTAITVTVNALPDTVLTPAPKTVCSNSAYTFTFDSITAGSGGNQIQWAPYSNFTDSTIASSPANISVTVSSGITDTVWIRSRESATGCVSSAITTTATNYTNPTATASNSGPYCSYGTISLSGGASGLSYSWSGPDSFSSTSQNPTRAASGNAGIYTLSVTNGNGCTATANTNVTVNTAPIATVSNTGPYCSYGSISLTGGPDSLDSYHWAGPNSFTSSSRDTALAASGDSGTYTLTVTDGNECSASASTSVAVNSLPAAPIAPAAKEVYGDTTYTFIDTAVAGSGADEVEWAKNNAFANSIIASSPTTINDTVAAGVTDTIWIRSKVSGTGCVSNAVTTTCQNYLLAPPQVFLSEFVYGVDSQTFFIDTISAGIGGDELEWALNDSFSGSTTVASPANITIELVGDITDTIWLRTVQSSTGKKSSPKMAMLGIGGGGGSPPGLDPNHNQPPQEGDCNSLINIVDKTNGKIINNEEYPSVWSNESIAFSITYTPDPGYRYTWALYPADNSSTIDDITFGSKVTAIEFPGNSHSLQWNYPGTLPPNLYAITFTALDNQGNANTTNSGGILFFAVYDGNWTATPNYSSATDCDEVVFSSNYLNVNDTYICNPDGDEDILCNSLEYFTVNWGDGSPEVGMGTGINEYIIDGCGDQTTPTAFTTIQNAVVANAPDFSHTYSTSGTYTITIGSSATTGSVETQAFQQQFTMYVGPPSISLSASDYQTCTQSTNPITIQSSVQASGPVSYSWSSSVDGPLSFTTANITVTPTEATIYSVTISDTYNTSCSATSSVSIGAFDCCQGETYYSESSEFTYTIPYQESPVYASTLDPTWFSGGAVNVAINCSLIVDDQFTITNTDIHMGQVADITVLPGASLILDNSSITTCDDYFWNGITVEGNTSYSQQPITGYGPTGTYHQGALFMSNGSSISNAATAIYVEPGGIVRANSSSFTNNSVDVMMEPYTYISSGSIELPNASLFIACNFTTSSDGLNEGVDPWAHIMLNSVHGVQILGCTFENEQTDLTYDYQLGDGIVTLDAGFTVDDYCGGTYPCTPIASQFTNLRHGVYAGGAAGVPGIGVYRSNFDHCVRAIRSEASDFGNFSGNNIKVGNATIVTDVIEDLPQYYNEGIVLNGTISFAVEGNNIDQVTDVDGSFLGIRADNTQTNPNQIFNNTVQNLFGSIIGQGQNLSSTPPLVGLQYLCNSQSNNCLDDYVSPRLPDEPNQLPIGIAPSQGSSSNPAGNTFTQSATGFCGLNFYNNSGNPITYYFHTNTSLYKPADVYGVTPSHTTPNETCPSNENNGTISFNPVLSGLSRSELSAQFSTNKQLYQADLLTYNATIDGGNTEAAETSVTTATALNANSVKSSLLAISPFVSEPVLSSFISRSDIYTDSDMVQLLMANPDAINSADLINQLYTTSIPDSLIDSVLANKANTTACTYLLDSVQRHSLSASIAVNEIINRILTDTDSINYACMRNWLDSIAKPWADEDKAFSYLQTDQFDSAVITLQAIPGKYALTPDDSLRFAGIDSLFSLYAVIRNTQGDSIFHYGLNSLDSSNFAIVDSFAAQSNQHLQGTTMARNIVNTLYSRAYFTSAIITVTDTTLQTLDSLDKRAKVHTTVNTNTPSIKVYPNPANDYVTFEVSTTNVAAILTVYDLYGRMVLQTQMGNTLTVNTGIWQSGTYIWQVSGSSINTQRGKLELINDR